MKLSTSHSEVFGSLADEVEKNGVKWKEVIFNITHTIKSFYAYFYPI